MTLRIAQHQLTGRAVLAPMAGVTDRPFRQLCRRFGAALAPAEMLSADQRLWTSSKSQRRMDHDGEPEPRVVQLVGSDPQQLAQAARVNVDLGARIIDLNMGCPAKKVYNRYCGSALLADESLIERILTAVVQAVPVPVTLKIRTGTDPARRNAPRIAALAQACGVAALTIHGRTRSDMFRGAAEHATLRATRAQVTLPLIANGDIDCAEQALAVLDFTGAEGVMIGRAAQGAPWIFRDVNARLAKEFAAPLLRASKTEIILQHLEALYEFYGEYTGLRMARKHLGWYCRQLFGDGSELRQALMATEDSASQFATAKRGFTLWAESDAA